MEHLGAEIRCLRVVACDMLGRVGCLRRVGNMLRRSESTEGRNGTVLVKTGLDCSIGIYAEHYGVEAVENILPIVVWGKLEGGVEEVSGFRIAEALKRYQGSEILSSPCEGLASSPVDILTFVV